MGLGSLGRLFKLLYFLQTSPANNRFLPKPLDEPVIIDVYRHVQQPGEDGATATRFATRGELLGGKENLRCLRWHFE